MPEWFPPVLTILLAAIGGGLLLERRLSRLEVHRESAEKMETRLNTMGEHLDESVRQLQSAVATLSATVEAYSAKWDRLDALEEEIRAARARLLAQHRRIRRLEEARDVGRVETPGR